MPTYIDLASLGPNDDIAHKRAIALGLSGKLLPRTYRGLLLSAAQAGDTVICGPRGLDFWRLLGPQVALVSIEDMVAQDLLPMRFTNTLEWLLVLNTVPRMEAAALVRNPPKTDKHRRWKLFNTLVPAAEYVYSTPPLPPLEELAAVKDSNEARPYTYKLVDNRDTYEEFVAKLAAYGGTLGIDVETDQVGDTVNEMHDILVGVGVAIGTDCYFGYTSYEPWMVGLRERLVGLPWIGHNGKYDLSVLRRYGIPVGPLVGDGMLAAYLLGEPNARLKDLVYRRFNHRMIRYEEVVGEGKNRIKISQADPRVVTEYCCGDAYWGVQIENLLHSELTGKVRELYENVDLPIATILCNMQFAGITFDRQTAARELRNTWRTQTQLARAIDTLVHEAGWSRPDRTWVCKGCRNGKKKRLTCERCHGVGKFSALQAINPGSSDQLVDFYHRHLGIPVQRLSKETGKPSVDALVLLRISQAHVTVPLILNWKRLKKYREFLQQWAKGSKRDGKLHPTYSNARVRSYRFSSEEPNVQQIKVDWRGMFRADEGQLLVAADHAQIEVRVGAYVSHDPTMLMIMQADPNTEAGDLHGQNVRALFGVPYDQQKLPQNRPLRVRAKNFFFGAMYGSKGDEVHAVIEKFMLEDPELAALGIPDVREIRRGISGIHDIYGRYFKEWRPYALEQARQNGNTVYTLFDRPRCIPDLTSADRQLREAAEREAISHIIQGTATADIMRLAMLQVARLPFGNLLINAHDELVSGVDEDRTEWYAGSMRTTMELGQPFEDVPLVVVVKTGKTWYDTHA